MNRKRLNTLKRVLRKKGLGTALITKKENVFYLSGFRGDGSLLITPAGNNYLITDSRFTQEALEGAGNFKVEITENPGAATLKLLTKKDNIRSLGFESQWLSHHNYSRLKTDLKNVRMRPTKNLVEDIRIVKDLTELSSIKKAISITKKAYCHVKRVIKKPGITEKKTAIEIDRFLRFAGSEKSAFETIVATRANSSRPHAHVSTRKLAKNGPVLIDMGCVYKGYHSDLTRMLFIGKIGDKFRSVYKIVKEAQGRAIKSIKPGARISEIDRAAREHIASKGFGKAFLHGLGHGIGLEIHEAPGISAGNNNRLKPGMVFTVEPGIYIPGWGGVRVEDIALVTRTGCTILTKGI